MKNWRDEVPNEIKRKMISKKVNHLYSPPNFFRTIVKKCVINGEMSHCLFYSVGVIIFKKEYKKELVSGYNGPASGDVHCNEVGCARVVDGELKKGSGLCRGSHAEINAISNASNNGINIQGASMMVTHKPCFACAKQIVNAGIKEVFYIFDYDGDEEGREYRESVEEYLRRLGVNVAQVQMPDSI